MRLKLANVAVELVYAALVGCRGRAFVAACPLAEDACGVAVVLQHLGQNLVLRIVRLLTHNSKIYVVAVHHGMLSRPILAVAAHVSVTRMLTRHYRSARGRRHRRTGVSLREAHALLSHAVDVGRADIGLSVAGEVAVTHVVAQYEYNVGLFRLHTLSRRLRSHERRHYGEGGAR
ncbi:unknown [Prevotella sp. CAG:520]|nr:unknown [Prevotella sp. CAG:520]